MKFQNKELFNLLKEKGKLVAEGRKLSVKIDSLETERNKKALQIQKLKDKMMPIVRQLVEGKLAEFEQISDVEAGKIINEVEVKTYDALELFKQSFREQNAPAQNDTESPQDTSEGDSPNPEPSLDS